MTMSIDPTELETQYRRAAADWPFIASYEVGLPPFILFAVGSRETNLTNEVGDGGHGHGVWQLDDRSHDIPDGFDDDVQHQAQVAAMLLAGMIHATGSVRNGVAAYNEGVDAALTNAAAGDVDAGTAHGNYSADVLARRDYLAQRFGNPPTPLTGGDDMPELIQYPGTGPSAGDNLKHLDAVYVHVNRAFQRHVTDPAERDSLLLAYSQTEVHKVTHSRRFFGPVVGVDPEAA